MARLADGIERCLDKLQFDAAQKEVVLLRFRQYIEQEAREIKSSKRLSLHNEISRIILYDEMDERFNKYRENTDNIEEKARYLASRHQVMREIWRCIEKRKENTSRGDLKLISLSKKYHETYDTLTDTVLGQDYAVNEFVQACFDADIYPDNPNTPRAVFLFAGPPGVGKTYLARSAAAILGRPFKIFDMGSFTEEKADLGLIGSETLFRNAAEGTLVSFVDDNPDAVILFDEIEKAHPNVMRLFLSILDGARLENKLLVSNTDFSNTIIIFTTNAGKGLYENRARNVLETRTQFSS